MTLEFFKDNQELMSQCVLWWQGRDQTTTGFPILPAGVTVTPSGTWANDLSLGNSKIVKTFAGAQYITLTNLTQLAFADVGMTMCFWIRYTSTNKMYIFSKFTTWSSNVDFHISFPVTPSRILYMNYLNTQNSLTDELPINTWIFVVITRAPGGLFKTYVNGDISKTWTNASAMYNNSSTLYIGRSTGNTINMAYGNFKDVMFYVGRVLTQAEIVTLMKLTSPILGRDVYPIYPGIRGVE